MRSDKRTILIAGMGTSPAVLTETVWALAHQKKPVVHNTRTLVQLA
jgi:CRISPR-associated protein (TIGR02584 family)